MTIRDLGYQRYEGKLLPHRTRHKVLIRRTLSLAWASGLVKTCVILGSFPMVVCGVFMFLKVKAMQHLAAQGAPFQIEDPAAYVFY